MKTELETWLYTLKQRNSGYYAEISCLQAKIEECTAMCNELEKMIEREDK